MTAPRFGIMSAMLRRVGAEAVDAAAAAGYAGIELDVGREAEAHPLFDEAGLAALRAALARTGLAVPSSPASCAANKPAAMFPVVACRRICSS